MVFLIIEWKIGNEWHSKSLVKGANGIICCKQWTVTCEHWARLFPTHTGHFGFSGKTTCKRRRNNQGWSTVYWTIRTQPAALISNLPLAVGRQNVRVDETAPRPRRLRPSIAHCFTAADDEEPQSCWHGTYTGTVGGLNVAVLSLPIAAQTDASLTAYHDDNGKLGPLSMCYQPIWQKKAILFKVRRTKLVARRGRWIKKRVGIMLLY